MKQLSKVEIAKLRQLSGFLETVPASRFGIEAWETKAYKPARTFLFGLVQIEPECGFAGCALGWAAHSQLFPGLMLDHGASEWGTALYYRGHMDFAAVAKLFNISKRAGQFLFHGENYKTETDFVTPGMVADRINRYCDKIEAALARKQYRTYPNGLPLRLVQVA